MREIKRLPEANLRKMLEKKAVLVTVNHRLARYLTDRFNRHQVDAGHAVWETPDILPYSAWLNRIWEQAGYYGGREWSENRKILLSPAQERYVWEGAINTAEAGADLLRISETADAAARAWELCRQWMLPLRELAQAPAEETAAYLAWARAFESRCREHNWLGNASLADTVAGLFESNAIEVPSTIILAGFDELTPQQMSLVRALEKMGCAVFILAFEEKFAEIQRCEPADTAAEISTAARWSRDRLAENPEARIGIIVQNVASLRSDLIRIFEDVFHPSMNLSPKSHQQRAFNISLGRPLSDYPIVNAALLILNFSARPLDVNEYSRLLLSPFIGGADPEFSLRAMLDARIRENGETVLPLSAMIYFSDEHAGRIYHPGVFCPQLSRRLKAFKNMTDRLPDRRKPSAWAKDFIGLLDTMGWSWGRSLASEELQTVNAWHEALQAFAALDAVCGEINISSAIAQLTQTIRATIFQSETDEVPVQIMGSLEAVGERFDYVWIMGMDAESWPSAPRPNPFLPVWLQKKYNVPHASPERELAYSREVTRRLLASADHVMVSSPKQDGDTALFPSPLISHLEKISVDIKDPSWRTDILNRAGFEQVTDQRGPAASEKSRISGGTGLLKNQAACPFSAFAAYRLQAKIPEIPESGLNARERGSLIHNTLELFWKDVKTSDDLKKLSDAELLKAIMRAVEFAVSEMAKKHPRTFTARFTELEKQRLISLVREFLAVDSRRTPFTVIGLEEKMVRTIAGIELKTYADRIDELEDGRLVIVDYKTGEPAVADWFTERIAEPQLPLYSFAVEKEVAGVVFARLKKGNVAYLGVIDEGGIIPGAAGPGDKRSPMEHAASLAPVIETWKSKIETLAEEVRQGLAAVSPVSIIKSCRYCDFKPMCRIGEIEYLKS